MTVVFTIALADNANRFRTTFENTRKSKVLLIRTLETLTCSQTH